MKRITFFSLILICLFGCSSQQNKNKTLEDNLPAARQPNAFDSLQSVLQLPQLNRSDSVKILILPIDVSCPACRDKAIKSIADNSSRISDNRIVIIAGSGRKNINFFFKELDKELPANVLIDSSGKSINAQIATSNPVFIRTYDHRLLSRAESDPGTIKEYLQSFFN